MNESLDAWFASEILVHEQALSYFLRRCWPHRDELHDLRQEVYVRVYEAAGKALPTTPKAFLFATARHLMADRVRRSRVVSIEAVGDFESLNVLIEEVTPERWSSGRQTLKRLAEAFDRLPDRCRKWSGCGGSKNSRKRKLPCAWVSARKPWKSTSPRACVCSPSISTAAAQPVADARQERAQAENGSEHGQQQTD